MRNGFYYSKQENALTLEISAEMTDYGKREKTEVGLYILKGKGDLNAASCNIVILRLACTSHWLVTLIKNGIPTADVQNHKLNGEVLFPAFLKSLMEFIINSKIWESQLQDAFYK